MSYTINMLNKSDKVKGQGVASASQEAISLIRGGIGANYEILENSKNFANITHIHSINPSFFLNINKYKKHGKVVGSVHFLPETIESSLNIPKVLKKIFYFYLLKMYRKMDYIVTVNPYFIEKLKDYGIEEEKIKYIPNFVDGKKFYKVGCSQKTGLRKKYNLSQNKFTVICVGQLQIRKGFFDFIECAERLKNFQFIWAGGFSFGPISDGYNKIKKIVKNPPKNVRFLGIVEREKMNEIYNLADVMFLPSFEELFPMTILEAMSCGLPILVRDIEIYEKILFDFYLKSRDVDGFSKILKKLSNDENYYNKASKMAFEGHSFYSSNHVLSMWKEFYSNVASSLQTN